MVNTVGLAERIGRHRSSLQATEQNIRNVQEKIALLNRRLRQLQDHRTAMLQSINETAAKLVAAEVESRGDSDQGPDNSPGSGSSGQPIAD